MFTIGLCDDEAAIRQNEKIIIEQFFFQKELEYKLVEFSSGEEMLQTLTEQENLKIDLLFLDIEMQGMSGIEVRDQLIRHDRVNRIIFVSSHTESMVDAFGYKTIGFLPKPVEAEALRKKLQVIIEEYENERMLRVGGAGVNPIMIDMERTLYLEADGNYTIIHYMDGAKPELIAIKLGDIEKNIATNSLLRIHKSFMINLNFVENITDKVTFVVEEPSVPVGRKYRDEVHQIYMNFVMRKAKEIF